MTRRSRADMIEETRGKLLAAARQAFTEQGYANTSMDDFTAAVGLTRGALYHHFGGKEGLLAALVRVLDAEMDARLEAISATATDAWEGFRGRCRAYLAMAQEADIRRILLQDAPAVLGMAAALNEEACVESLDAQLEALMAAGLVESGPSRALARLINGSLDDAALWIAAGEPQDGRLEQSLEALDLLLRGLRRG
ncbi:TetR/AcrR family transcriptional regulator [Pseudomonas citronellolis]|uniref:TetR/AcrR family transcriptional regulator n=1 Tax=Pseudomonas citronellolis TaxID=53408 RepID=UPI0023E44487|nr:TetR/AcrR family transcriptional regulator [Pseudomonas citronellolis]MDF3936170.1 helix-turn-helix domain containing protein [Pseudomonas citronellolis]